MVVDHLSILTRKKGEELPLNDFFLDDKMFVSIQKETKEHTRQRPRPILGVVCIPGREDKGAIF